MNFTNNTVKVLGKGNKERLIPIGAALAGAVKEYIDEKRASRLPAAAEALLITKKGKKLSPRSVYASVKEYLSHVTTIDKRSAHILRQTFATHLSNNGPDLNAVKQLLGHSSLAPTQEYTHNTIEKGKKVHQKAHPNS